MARDPGLQEAPGARRPGRPTGGAGGGDRSEQDPFVTILCAALGIMTLVTGAWAFVAPASFFDVIAPFEPYNRHFIHDAGAFSIGVSVGLLLTSAHQTGAAVGLGGYTASAVLHLISHLLDHDLGGNPARDLPYLTVLAIAGIAGLAAIRRRRSRGVGLRS